MIKMENVLENIESTGFIFGAPPVDGKVRLCFAATCLRKDEGYGRHRKLSGNGETLIQRGFVEDGNFMNDNGFLGWRPTRIIAYHPAPVAYTRPLSPCEWDGIYMELSKDIKKTAYLVEIEHLEKARHEIEGIIEFYKGKMEKNET